MRANCSRAMVKSGAKSKIKTPFNITNLSPSRRFCLLTLDSAIHTAGHVAIPWNCMRFHQVCVHIHKARENHRTTSCNFGSSINRFHVGEPRTNILFFYSLYYTIFNEDIAQHETFSVALP
jgi:hypothetical protein